MCMYVCMYIYRADYQIIKKKYIYIYSQNSENPILCHVSYLIFNFCAE